MKLHTLTVQDLLWINLQVTGAPQGYTFATLEEATFCQYSSGRNDDWAGQAARVLSGFARLAPFGEGNAATAFVACQAFLMANGKELDVSDEEAAGWLESVWDGRAEAVAGRVKDSQGHWERFGVHDARAIVGHVLSRYPKTLAALSAT